MNNNKVLYRFLAGIFAVFAGLGLVDPANAYSIYRGVSTTAGTGAVIWNAANFGVSGGPPTLSFSYYATDALAQVGLPQYDCLIKVDLVNTGPVPNPQAQDTVGNVNIAVGGNPVDQPLVFPWTALFDNNPAGHWSIARGVISGAGANNAASRVAAASFAILATTALSNVTVIDGNVANCIP